MPGHIMPLEAQEAAVMQALTIGVAHAAIDVRDSASFLAPKLTDELASDIQANTVRRSGKKVSSRIHTQSDDYYGIFQEKKDYYKHKLGQAHYMQNAILMNAINIRDKVLEALKGL